MSEQPVPRAGLSMIDWSLATSTAQGLLPNGPQVVRAEADALVAGLYAAAQDAVQPIADVTRMHPSAPMAPVVVVDRHRWIEANVTGFREAIAPLLDVLSARRAAEGAAAADAEGSGGEAIAASSSGAGIADAVGPRITGLQVGSLLAFVGGKVLGQHELFTAPGTAPRLLLVAPNMLAAERTLGVDPQAFRLWVCLHEQTHRVQLAAVPWLRAHVESELAALLDAADLDPDSLRERLSTAVAGAASAVRGDDGPSLLELVQTPEQKAILDRLVALMSLLEGHADWAMDEVGDAVVPGVADVRAAFERRRDGVGSLDRILRRLFGLDQKLAQYRDGAAFVRGVVAAVGVEGLNAAWSGADTLPMRSEIADPAAWVRRVHGAGGPA